MVPQMDLKMILVIIEALVAVISTMIEGQVRQRTGARAEFLQTWPEPPVPH